MAGMMPAFCGTWQKPIIGPLQVGSLAMIGGVILLFPKSTRWTGVFLIGASILGNYLCNKMLIDNLFNIYKKTG